jgi:hypothetical protein
MGAISASAASAHTFDYEVDHTLLMAEAKTEQVFSTGTGEVKCKKVTLSPTDPLNTKLWGVGETNGHPSATARPTYSECMANIAGIGLVTATVEFTSCYYEFTGETTAGTEHAPVHVRCETPGDEIHVKITASKLKCYTIPAQTVEGVHYTNTGAGNTRDVDIKATVTSIEATKEGGCGAGLEENATYSGEATVTGTDTNENQVGVFTTP